MTESGKSPRIDVSLPTLLDSVRTLQTALQTKAKNEPAARFYSLWDKVCREDVLQEAYRRCRANRGAPGVDGERFEHIEEHGRSAWLERLRQELTGKTYHPRPLLRVWILKASGGERPLGIPCIRDRVVQMAVLLVIGQGEHAMGAMRSLMDRLGLTVNEKKTRLVKLPDERFDFLGYTVGRFYGREGRSYWGTRPSRKSIKRLIREIHDATTSRWNELDIQSRIDHLNPMIRGWAGYFSQGPVSRIYRLIDRYTARRLRIWLMRRRGKRGTGYRQYTDQFLYETLGLIRLLPTSNDRANAKV